MRINIKLFHNREPKHSFKKKTIAGYNELPLCICLLMQNCALLFFSYWELIYKDDWQDKIHLTFGSDKQ